MNLTIENLTITSGSTTSAPGDPGGAGLMIAGAAVSLDQIIISDEYAVEVKRKGFPQCPEARAGSRLGGLARVEQSTSRAALTLQDDTFTGDSADGVFGGSSGFGGAIYVAGGV